METGWTLGYARVSTTGQDLTAQTDALVALGVPAERVFTEKGMTGTRRDSPLSWQHAAPVTRWWSQSSIASLDRCETRRTLPRN
jgi:hypothetical protein